jgi:hypothetical protein
MSGPRRPLAVASGAAAAAAAVAMVLPSAPASAEPIGPGWEGSSSVRDGQRVTGTALVVLLSFDGPPGSNITDIALELEPRAGSDCPRAAFNEDVGEGDGAGTPPTTTPTQPSPTQPSPTQPSPTPPTTTTAPTNERASYTFQVDPGCNGTYDLTAFATTDPAGPGEPGDPGTQSPDLEIEGVVVSLAPSKPASVAAEAAADRRVTVRWTPPPGWGDMRDAIGYEVRRVAADGTSVTVADGLDRDATSVVDTSAATAPGGRYQYNVVALRADASGAPVSSQPAQASVDLPGTGGGTGTGTGGTGAGSGGSTTGGRSSGRTTPLPLPGLPTVTPSTEYDPGFQEVLDYSDVEVGEEQAVPPADAGLFDVSERTPGTGLAVPGAVALCLVVWAGHLRHLARRAAPPVR